MITLEELKDLKPGDAVLCLQSDSNPPPYSYFTKNKIYIIGGAYYLSNRKRLELLLTTRPDSFVQDAVYSDNFVAVVADDKGNGNAWRPQNFISLKNKDLTTVKILYGIE